MSAFVCSDKHIATIAVAYAETTHPLLAQGYANTLLAENIRQVNYRYRETAPLRSCRLAGAEIRSTLDLSTLCACLSYQCSETDDWNTTEAWRLLQDIKSEFVSRPFQGRLTQGLWSI